MSSIIPTSFCEKLKTSVLTGENAEIAEFRERILIVDDEFAVRSVFADCLSERFDCVAVGSTKEALSQLAAADFSLVITDVLMPGLSGVELLRKIVESYPDTTVIMISGINNPHRALDAVRLGAFDYLIKPCDMSGLQMTVERALEQRALRLEAARNKRELEARNLELARQKDELERLQAQIVHSEKMASLGQLAAGIAHELNNPVGFIYGNLEILKLNLNDMRDLLRFYDSSPLPPEIAERAAAIKDDIDYEPILEDLDTMIEDCRTGAERIRDIVQNLRTFCRLDEAELKKSDLHEGLDSTLRLLSRYYSADKIVLRRDYGSLPLVETYGAQINQVWMNLLVNAAQAVGANGGEVTISTRTQNDFVTVAVSDTGSGILPAHLKRIFDPFFTTKPVGEGTGLGLSISFGIVERHYGTINVESQINHGTTFTVTLPVNHYAAVTETAV